jgi:hypothetical protein
VSGLLAVPLAAAGVVLATAGVAKLRAPGPAAQALAIARLPSGEPLVRVASLLEFAAGAYAVAAGGRVAGAVVLLAFVGFIAVTARLGREARSCGCFGSDDAPTSRWHLALCALFAGVGGCAVAWPPRAIAAAGGPLTVAIAVAAAGGAGYAAKLVYTDLPRAWGAWSA